MTEQSTERCKAITIHQPWASLIAHGIKDVENRTWTTRYRGPLIIHAGRSLDSIKSLDLATRFRFGAISDDPKDWPRGGVVARCKLVDIVRDSPSSWAAPGSYHWLLADVEPVEFRPCRGFQGLWEYRSR